MLSDHGTSMATRIAMDGLVACVPFSIVVWASFLSRPRIWLHSLPADIQRMAGPKTPVERRLTLWLGALVLFTFFGVPALLTWRFHMWTPGGLSFGQALTHLYGVWMTVNAWDLLAIDWPYAYLVDTSRPPIPGTEGAPGYKDYGFHARAFLKASVFGLVVVIPAAALIARSQGGSYEHTRNTEASERIPAFADVTRGSEHCSCLPGRQRPGPAIRRGDGRTHLAAADGCAGSDRVLTSRSSGCRSRRGKAPLEGVVTRGGEGRDRRRVSRASALIQPDPSEWRWLRR